MSEGQWSEAGLSQIYAEIGAVRIQRYLARTPRLRGRRGASAALAEVTRAAELEPMLNGLARVNPDAGEADGVVSLVLADGADTDTVISRVFGHLRERLPGAEFQATWAPGADYPSAYREMKAKRKRGEVRRDFPAMLEFPFALPCMLCRTAAAVGQIKLGEDDVKQVCADCRMRESRDVRALGETAEGWLAAAMNCADTPDEFDDLAALGSDDNRNHLATVYADGNAMGDFFDRLADPTADFRGTDQPGSGSACGGGEEIRAGKSELSRLVNEHTRTALKVATEAVRRNGDPSLWVVPHLVGGDDVLVSLPADRAWPFVHALLRTFSDLMTQTATDMNDPPTASAGLVISHSSTPFSMVVDAAERGLREAKSLTRGRAPSVHLLDVTVDGLNSTPHPALRLDAVEAAAADLDRLREVPKSGLARLARALAEGGPADARTLAARLGRLDAVEPFLPGKGTACRDESPGRRTSPGPKEPTGKQKSTSHREQPGRREPSGQQDSPGEQESAGCERIDLAHALRIVRWWPCA